ncbi:hypothetical protein [Streptomyces sp. NPDC004533]|uniref:hypothetical protein n=1 Tax=Streptomyces sp. NPDC004533 TaxID=3154278 RepID=UPI0033AD2F53
MRGEASCPALDRQGSARAAAPPLIPGREFAGVDVIGGEVVLDLLDGEAVDADRGAYEFPGGCGSLAGAGAGGEPGGDGRGRDANGAVQGRVC